MAAKAAKAAAREEYDRIAGWVVKLRRDCPEFRLLVLGETGAGKSTLINNLLGKKVAGVGHSTNSVTSTVRCYEGVIEGVPVKVYDTPGLSDSRSDRDEEYLEETKKLIETEPIHLIIYCLKMIETRMRQSIIRTFQQYTQIGVDWRKTAIALTFADALTLPADLQKEKGFSLPAYFKEKLAELKAKIPTAIPAEIDLEDTEVTQIRINPTTGNYGQPLPDGEEWYIPFWLDVLDILPPAARIRFVDIHKDNIKYGDKEMREMPELPNNFHLPPPPTSEESSPPLSLKSSSDSDNGTRKKPVIVLEGERRERFEKSIGEAVGIAAGITVAGAVGATVVGIGGAAAVVAGVAAAPIVLPAAAVGAVAGVLGAFATKVFGFW